MGLFFWKNNRKIDIFASALAEDLFSHVQPEIASRFVAGQLDKDKKKRLKTEQWLASVNNEMRKFAEANDLGIYGQARLQKQFSDRLLELGYGDEAVRRIVEGMLFRAA